MADDFYAEMGIASSATLEEIRAAYRAQARRRHPDNGGDPAAMARLNVAYGILSDPAARAAYDRNRRPGPEPDGPDTVDGDEVDSVPLLHGVARRLPWIAALVVLAFLFIFTAYAGGPSREPVRPSSSSPVGRCLEEQPALDAFIDCPDFGGREVMAEVEIESRCPPATEAHRVRGRQQVVCLKPR